MKLGKICTFVAALAICSMPAIAQENTRRGIAFVEAPEMASGNCTGRNANAAFSCARKQCVENGGTKEDCIEIAYCFPAKTSVGISLQSSEGFSWTEYYCGLESRELALALAKTLCNKKLRSDATECMPFMLYDEDGGQEEVSN